MRVLIPVLVALIVPLAASAQVPAPILVEPPDTSGRSSTIYLQGTLLGGFKYVQDGVYRPAGGSFGKLGQALSDVPEARALAAEGSRIVTHGRILSMLGAAVGATTFFVHGERAELGLSIGGFLVAAVGGAIQMKGRNRVNEAVWIFNEAQQQPATLPDDYRTSAMAPAKDP